MKKILLIDDSKDLLDFFEILLEKRGYIVQTELGVKNVYQKLSDFSPDLIILDVMMWGKDGRELCAEIKKEWLYKDVQIILVSASPELLTDYEQFGACDFIEKPFAINTVYKKIESCLSHSPKSQTALSI